MNNGSLTALYLLHSLGLRLCRAVEAQYHSSTFSMPSADVPATIDVSSRRLNLRFLARN